MKRVEARRRELQEKEILLKREQEKVAQEILIRETELPALQSPFEDKKSREKDQPRVPLRDIPVNQVDSFRKPKLPKSVSPNLVPNQSPRVGASLSPPINRTKFHHQMLFLSQMSRLYRLVSLLPLQ